MAAAIGAIAAGLLAGCSDSDAPADTDASTTPTAAPVVLVASPSSLASYRYEVTVTALLGALSAEAPEALSTQTATITVEGSRLNPDREQSRSLVEIGPLSVEVETIRIGEQQWVREGTRPWTESVGGGMDVLGGADFRPAALFAEDPAEYVALGERLAGYPSSEVMLEGIPARHFTFTEEEFFAVFQNQGDIVPPSVDATLSAEVWLSRELGTPIRLVVVGTATDESEVIRLEMDILDLNDPAIEVEPPI
ncbi:MAG: hypothetical protein DWG80_05705 [Chloroflexi bacterium]|nr:hypothetical protein [Chloroflexota bacterium]MQC18552.1 hypothetical protein [Chloroflexota bacterium]